MRPRVSGLAITAVLSLAVLVVGHNLVFLLTYGSDYSAALTRTGHDGRWDETVRVVLAVAGLLAAVGTARLLWLYYCARRLGAAGQPVGPTMPAYVRALLLLWAQLFAIATLLFVLQENYERWSVGLALPGVAVLSPAGEAGPMPVFLLLSLVVAAVGALFRLGIAVLEARVADERSRGLRLRSAPRTLRHYSPLPRPSSVIGRNLAGRAPPTALPA
jgi:hypothetical protein